MLRWLTHELGYGVVQRRYARRWLQHLSGTRLFEDGELDAPVAIDERCASLLDTSSNSS